MELTAAAVLELLRLLKCAQTRLTPLLHKLDSLERLTIDERESLKRERRWMHVVGASQVSLIYCSPHARCSSTEVVVRAVLCKLLAHLLAI